MSKTKTLSDLASFVGRSAIPRKNRSEFWNAYNTATFKEQHHTEAASASDLLAMVMTISARTRRIVAPRTLIELDVFAPNGARAVQLIMGNYNES